MAMIYTLVTSAKEWLAERFIEENGGNAEAEEAAKDDVRPFYFMNILVNFLLV